jgi:hypothetical protein
MSWGYGNDPVDDLKRAEAAEAFEQAQRENPASISILDNNPDSRYGVICDDECGKQGLSKAEYDRQMNRPNTWICPRCRGFAFWDDDRLEDETKTFPKK